MANIYLEQEQFENMFKRHIKTQVYSLSIKTLFGDRYSRKVTYDPYYQRNYVWDKAKASFFIESILLGTDIPPLIFFNSGPEIEVIDGRQRFETIKRFLNGELKLNVGGLTKLTQLKNHTFSRLGSDIQSIFKDAKIRIFEFEVINEPRLEASLEDKVKKEIFRRYNSGITPLNTAEIDNANFDDDDITNVFKAELRSNDKLVDELKNLFMARKTGEASAMLQFLRKYLVLANFPINTFATGSNRQEIFKLLYSVKSDNTQDVNELCNSLFKNMELTIGLLKEFKNESSRSNRLINECLLWGVNILREEGVGLGDLLKPENVNVLENYIQNHGKDFLTDNSHHYISILIRFKSIASILRQITGFDFSIYLRDDEFKNKVKELRQSEGDAKLKLDELASLRVQKPDPSLIPIEEIVSELGGSRFLVRPSYQRKEKINLVKASAIIESILLGISLPPIFIFKRKGGIKEVIDGQQRLLSILGYLGKQYQDENGELVYPKNINYKLSRLKILTNLNGTNYSDLDFTLQDKILDFKLSLVEIDEVLNNHFDPVDLFIRLNNKPYPIKENSFEMWNSFMDKDVIEEIRRITDENIDWFFIKKRTKETTSDRMQNEELVALLSYVRYSSLFREDYKAIGYYLRDGRINCRIGDKKDVSSLLESASTNSSVKEQYLESIGLVEDDILQLKSKLDPNGLKESLTALFKDDPSSSRRLLVDFYTLFQILERLNNDTIESISLIDLKDKLLTIQSEFINPTPIRSPMTYHQHFTNLLDSLSNELNENS